MLTQKDMEEVETLVRKVVKDEVKHLPSKDQFFERMDKVSGELQAIREELALQSGTRDEVEEHDERLGKHHRRLSTLEKVNKLPTPVDE